MQGINKQRENQTMDTDFDERNVTSMPGGEPWQSVDTETILSTRRAIPGGIHTVNPSNLEPRIDHRGLLGIQEFWRRQKIL